MAFLRNLRNLWMLLPHGILFARFPQQHEIIAPCGSFANTSGVRQDYTPRKSDWEKEDL